MTEQTVYSWFKFKKEFLDNNYKKTPRMCAYCNKVEGIDENFKKCSACYLTTYCSKDCQKKHWKIVHKYKCFSNFQYKTKESKSALKTFQITLKAYYYEYLEDIKNGISNNCLIFKDDNDNKYWHIINLEDKYLLFKSTKEHYLEECLNNNWIYSIDSWKYFFGDIIGKVEISKVEKT